MISWKQLTTRVKHGGSAQLATASPQPMVIITPSTSMKPIMSIPSINVAHHPKDKVVVAMVVVVRDVAEIPRRNTNWNNVCPK